ncbi:IS110 family transposase [Azospirillum sp. B2RO_4]|uniref:IS110 family transposase n=1 Tax=Azospirillum sp. B2RO_4 TaxID=3027796 RepID=UPI003DA7C0F8
MSTIAVTAGIDCGKSRLDVALFGAEDKFHVVNTGDGHRELIARLTSHGVCRVGMEASGGYERGVRTALRDAGLPVTVFDPARVRCFAKAKGLRAKNDRIDAAVIAEFTASALALADSLSDPEHEELAGYVRLRRLLSDKRADLKRVAAMLDGEARGILATAMEGLDRAIEAVEVKLRERTRAQTALGATIERLCSAPGIGWITAMSLAVLLPELGRISSKQIAALAGVAPFDRDSGRWHGQRHIAGGRADVRRTLYMAAQVAATRTSGAIADFYNRLRAKGKPAKVALTACMHKLIVRLNAMIAKGQDWTVKSA